MNTISAQQPRKDRHQPVLQLSQDPESVISMPTSTEEVTSTSRVPLRIATSNCESRTSISTSALENSTIFSLAVEEKSVCNISASPCGSKRLRLSEVENLSPSPSSLLPKEILLKIYKSLSSADRKNFKLVCWRWFDACFLNEKICIGSEYFSTLSKTEEVLSTLSKSLRSTLHFEFYSADFEDTTPIAIFWHTCGPNIVSLKLEHCNKPSAHLIRWISRCCKRLQILKWSFSTLTGMRKLIKFAREISSSSAFKNHSLETLRVTCEFKWRCSLAFWIPLQRTLFNLFPNVRTFEFSAYDLVGLLASYFCNKTNPWMITKEERNVASTDKSKFRKKLQKCYTSGTVKNIAINFIFEFQDCLYDSLTDVTGLTKITEISIISDFGIREASSFLKFTREQRNLKKITCVSNKCIQRNNLNAFMPEILKIKSLRELRLLFFRSLVDWNYGWSASLSVSNIQILQVICLLLTFSRGSSYFIPSNTTLSQIIIYNMRSNEYILSLNSLHIINLLKKFPNVKYLYLSYANEMILKFIYQNLVKLEHLSLGVIYASSYSSSTSSNPVLGFNKLGDLRYLEFPHEFTSTINQIHSGPRNSFTKLMSNEYFDRLTVLRIYGVRASNHVFEPENLEVCKRLSRTLEVVWIDSFVKDPGYYNYDSHRESVEDAITKFVSEQKTLKVLNLNYLQRDSTEEIWLNLNDRSVKRSIDVVAEYSFAQRVFGRCPSLQIFVYRGAFVYDVFEKAVRPFKQNLHVIYKEITRRYFRMQDISF